MEEKIVQRKRKKIKDEKQNSYSGPKRQLSRENENSYGLVFWAIVALSQIIGVTIVILLVVWGNEYGGFVVTDVQKLFNFHPLFMVLGLVIFYGDAIIVYRVLSFLPKPILKIIHAVLHIGAIAFSSLALAAVFENHKRLKYADMYSLHSWFGIIAFGAFCLQYIGGFVAYLYPGLPGNWRSKIMPYHLFFGIGIFALAVGTVGMGINEKLGFGSYSKLQRQSVIGNVIGLLVLVFAFLIVYLATHSTYKRKPLPNEVPSLPTN